MMNARDYLLLSALAVICVASIIHLLPRRDDAGESECQCQCECLSGTSVGLVSPHSAPGSLEENEEKATTVKPSPTSSPIRQPLFETLKNVRPDVTFTWPTPMPLLPPDEARAFLREVRIIACRSSAVPSSSHYL